MYKTKEELIEAIKNAINYMKEGGSGCYTLELDSRLAICIGWCGGYDPADIDLIHAVDDETYCLNAGIKVHTSDSMRTDYEYINAPYYDSGDVWSTDVSLGYHEDVEELVEYLLKEYEAMKVCVIEDDGRIDNFRCPEDYCSGLFTE